MPVGSGWWYEVKLDGHRTVLWRGPDGVRLQARSGRDVTAAWTDIAAAGLQLPVGTVIDGEAVVYVEGRISFSAAQSRAASTPARARVLAEQRPASYAVWDILAHPDLGDVRPRPYSARRALLLELLEDIRPPIQVVPATDDPETARFWYDTLHTQGVEGIVAKHANSPYRASRLWKKVRHAETVDAELVGYTGPPVRPRHAAVRLPDGRTVLSQTLSPRLAARISAHLATSGPPRRARTSGGDTYSTTGPGIVVEVLAGTTRHAVVTVTRVR
ncbi:DNA ligase [Streptomyces lavendulocolor]|uniref:ATP-dependent DNA ligase n=1 Tax=Streptomyces lavendulocolor TaxID=67316 RepID=UPI003C2FC854